MHIFCKRFHSTWNTAACVEKTMSEQVTVIPVCITAIIALLAAC